MAASGIGLAQSDGHIGFGALTEFLGILAILLAYMVFGWRKSLTVELVLQYMPLYDQILPLRCKGIVLIVETDNFLQNPLRLSQE